MARRHAEISQSSLISQLRTVTQVCDVGPVYVFLSILRILIVSPVLSFSGLIPHTSCYDKTEVQTQADQTCTNPLMSLTFAGEPDQVSICRYMYISAQLTSFFTDMNAVDLLTYPMT